MRLLSAFAVLSVIVGTAAACTDGDLPPSYFRVAFVGDTPISAKDDAVFAMLQRSGVEMIIHSGDFSASWDINTIFEKLKGMRTSFPFVAALGDKDLQMGYCGFSCAEAWAANHADLLREQAEEAKVQCSGGAGTMEKCHYNGIVVVNMAYNVGIKWAKPTDYARFINDAFAEHPNAYWRICNFHVPEYIYSQDRDPVVMEACRANGAIVLNGHDHSYIRTKLMNSYSTWEVSSFTSWDATNPYGMAYDADSTTSVIDLAPGRSIQLVCGLGGYRPEVPFRASEYDYVAKTWPENTEDISLAKGGAVICTFNPDSSAFKPHLAECVFRDTEDNDHDEFILRSRQYDREIVEQVVTEIEEERQEAKRACFSCFGFF